MLFLDTANLEEIKEYWGWGCFAGVTTNPRIFRDSKQSYSREAYYQNIRAICELTDAPVSVELTEGILGAVDEAKTLASLHPRVVVKVPLWPDGRGLKVISRVSEAKIPVNATVLMKSSQAIMAAEAGAIYVSLFYRRMFDAGGLVYAKKQIQETRRYLDLNESNAKIIAGSIRQEVDVVNCLGYGADIVTVPPKFLCEMANHKKTADTIAEFDTAWREYVSG